MNLRKITIIAVYVLIFWFIIPILIIVSSNRLEIIINFDQSKFNPSIYAGVIILAVSVLLLVISIWQYFKYSGELPVSAYPPKNIIRRGLYNYWRHPIYLFYVASFAGIALLMRSLAMLICVMPLFVMCTFIYICIEERGLTKRYGETYKHYKKATGLVLPVLYQLLRYPGLLLLKLMFRFQSGNSNLIPVSPPYYIIAEHKNYLDPIFIAAAIPYPISYLTTYEVFRTPLLKWFLLRLFSIPKKRFRPDYTSNKKMFETLERGGVIGLFPEGERSWTGETQKFKPEVLKLLLKKNNIPLLPVKIQGHYHAWPRWSKGFRRYKIKVEFREPFYPDPDCSAEDLEYKIMESIGSYSPPVKISGKCSDFAVGLEKVFYRCSECSEFNTFRVHNNTLMCEKCGLKLHISGDLIVGIGKNRSSVNCSIAEYYRTIRVTPEDPLLKNIDMEGVQCFSRQEILVCLHESGKCQLFAESGNRFQSLLKGELILSEYSLMFKNESTAISFRYKDISSVTTESNDKLQIFNQSARKLYQVEFYNASVLQWQDIIKSVIFLKTGKSINTR